MEDFEVDENTLDNALTRMSAIMQGLSTKATGMGRPGSKGNPISISPKGGAAYSSRLQTLKA